MDVDCITRICRTMRRSHTWEIDDIAFAAANRAHDAHHASVCSGRGQGKSGSIERVAIEPSIQRTVSPFAYQKFGQFAAGHFRKICQACPFAAQKFGQIAAGLKPTQANFKR